jgi:conjugal transfer/entry exclusion protein
MLALLNQVQSLKNALQGGLTQLQNAATRLRGGNLVDDILIGHRNITADINAISYSIETVSTQFQRVFPNDEAVRNTPPSDVADLKNGWDREIHQSGLAAARAQSSLSIIERNTASANQILESSKATTQNNEGSELAKLQAVVQMLGVINSDLTTLATTIATTERVNASLAGAEASEYDVSVERSRRLRQGYADPTPNIPEIDSRFLR